MAESPLSPLAIAIAGAITGDAQITGAGLLHSTRPVYQGQPPEAATLNYVILDGAGHTSKSVFHRRGHDTTQRLRVCAANRLQCLAIFGHLTRLFDGVKLSLSGHGMVRGQLHAMTDFADPSGTAHILVADYVTLTRVNA